MDKTNEGDDAQRTLEQKALTNVRGLVDKIEASDQADKVLQRRILIGFVVTVAILAALWASGVIDFGRGKVGGEVVVQPPKAPGK